MTPPLDDVDLLSTRSHTDRFTWSDVRDDAIKRFGAAPSAEIETEVLERFEARPRLVVEEIKRVAEDLANGRVRSGWPILRSRLQGSEPARDVVVVDEGDRERAVANAERWIRSAGCHFPTFEEVELALFSDGYGDRGQTLRRWRADEELRARLFDRWADLRAGVEELEAAELERAQRWKADNERVRRALAAVRASV